MKHAIRLIAVALVVAAPWSAAQPFPIGFSARGGIGVGYYSMTELDDHFDEVARDFDLQMPALSKGVNVMLQGRVWLFDFIAACAGFEHFWGESQLDTGDIAPVTYKAPADILTIGGAVKAFSVTDVFDLNLGVNGCFAKATFGTNLLSPRRLSEYKGNDWGFELFAEAASNFLYPVEISVQMGYRRLTVDGLEDKFGDVAYFPGSTAPVSLEYSGFMLYLAAGIRL